MPAHGHVAAKEDVGGALELETVVEAFEASEVAIHDYRFWQTTLYSRFEGFLLSQKDLAVAIVFFKPGGGVLHHRANPSVEGLLLTPKVAFLAVGARGEHGGDTGD